MNIGPRDYIIPQFILDNVDTLTIMGIVGVILYLAISKWAGDL